MEIIVKEAEPCKLNVHYVGDAEEIINKRAKVLEQFKKAPMSGFRPGKAPIDAIKMHYRDQIEESLKRALAEDAYHNTLFEKKLRPHGAPRFNNLLLDGGKFVCDFDLFIKPDFELAEFRNLEVPKPSNIQDGVVMAEAMMQEIRTHFGDVAPYADSDFVQTGDNVIIDYEGAVDGERVDNLCASGEMLTVGKSHLPIFDSNLLGMSIGETREFDMQVPANGLPSLAGKTVHLKVTLNTGSKSTPAPLDDELAKKLGKKDFAELRDFVGQTASGKAHNNFRMQLNEAVARRLISDNQVPVPPWLSLSEAQYLVHQAKLDWNTLVDADKEQYINVAEQNVKLALILDRIREKEPEAQLSDQEVFEIIKRNLAQTKVQTSIDDVIKEMNRTGYLQILFSRIKDEHALEFCVKSVRVIE
jgi:trigger factor